jgi:protein-disulfide isomerase
MSRFKKKVLMYLDEDCTQHLFARAEDTEDEEMLVILVERAKKIWANNISEADQLINSKK